MDNNHSYINWENSLQRGDTVEARKNGIIYLGIVHSNRDNRVLVRCCHRPDRPRRSLKLPKRHTIFFNEKNGVFPTYETIEEDRKVFLCPTIFGEAAGTTKPEISVGGKPPVQTDMREGEQEPGVALKTMDEAMETVKRAFNRVKV